MSTVSQREANLRGVMRSTHVCQIRRGTAFAGLVFSLLLSPSHGFATTPKMKVKGLLLDMDGTLTDSDALHFEAYKEVLLELAPEYNDGKPLSRAFYDDSMSGQSNARIVPQLLPDWPYKQQERLWERKEEIYRDLSGSMKPLPGLFEMLDWCDETGVKKIIVTNAPRLDAEHTLKVLGLKDRLYDTIVIGTECTRAKPFPDPYLEGMKRLGLGVADCLAFEDSYSGLSSAVAAGVRTAAVLTSRKEADMLQRGASFCIKDFASPKLWQVLRGEE